MSFSVLTRAGSVSDLQIALKPDAVLRRITEAMNRPARRILGLKIANEYVGVVQGHRFEVWERRRHAVHLLGEVRPKRDGSRVELRTGLTLRARIFLISALVLLVIFAVGMATLPAERAFPEATPFLTVGAVLAAAVIFYRSAEAQAADLRAFVAKALEEPRSVGKS